MFQQWQIDVWGRFITSVCDSSTRLNFALRVCVWSYSSGQAWDWLRGKYMQQGFLMQDTALRSLVEAELEVAHVEMTGQVRMGAWVELQLNWRYVSALFALFSWLQPLHDCRISPEKAGLDTDWTISIFEFPGLVLFMNQPSQRTCSGQHTIKEYKSEFVILWITEL